MNESIIKFPITGNSMWPTIASGEILLIDTSSIKTDKGDILLYKSRYNSDYTVHRLIEPGITKGDSSILYDEKTDFSVFGKVIGVEKNKRTFIWGIKGQPLKKMLSKISHYRTKGFSIRLSSKILLYLTTQISFLLCSIPKKDHT
jgi:hypothetical protein